MAITFIFSNPKHNGCLLLNQQHSIKHLFQLSLLFNIQWFSWVPNSPNPSNTKKPIISTKISTNLASKFKVRSGFLPVDPWAPNIDSQSIASQLFAASLFPYLGFLYFIIKSKAAPKLTLVGFYFLLAFVGATIPAGIYAKVRYGTSLANVDWLHGGAESLLTITNLLVVLGLREALRKIQDVKKDAPLAHSKTKNKSSV